MNEEVRYGAEAGTLCEWCGQVSRMIIVHGHEQCPVCHTNNRPCCEGEVASIKESS